MSYEEKMLWGIPIVETDAMPKGVVIFGPMPTAEDLMRYGSLENYVEAKKYEYAMIRLDDEVLDSDVVE